MADIARAKKILDREMRDEEGERLVAYLCSAGVPTIGVGATSYPDGRKVQLSDPPITREFMDYMLSFELDRYIGQIMEMVDGIATTNQLIALVRCGYNIGLEGLRGSTMIRQHRLGNYQAAGRAFSLWNKVRNPRTKKLEVNDAITARRAREAAVYLTPDPGTVVAMMPQSVEGESNLARSPINLGGAITIGSGALTLASVSETATQGAGLVATLRTIAVDAAELVGVPPGVLLGLVLVGVGAVVVINRWRQRRDGWA